MISRRFAVRYLAAIAVVLTGLPVLIGALFMMALTSPQCGAEIVPPVPHEDVRFPSSEFSGRDTAAWFIPGMGTGSEPAATVIILPTLSAGRGDRMAEAMIYHELGLNLLMFESRACVGGVGPSLGASEAAQVGDALDYLAARADVDSGRIGLHGFSAGGAAALMAAAQFSGVAAVVAQGNYADFEAELLQTTRELGLLKPGFDLGAQFGYRLMTGRALSDLSPLEAMPSIRAPVLLVYGALEPSLAGAHELAAAGANVTLWIVPGASHGDYLSVSGEEYARQVGQWMVDALNE